MDRIAEITKLLPLNGKGLEIAPLFRPTLKKPQYDIDYTDYLPTEELRARDGGHPESVNLVDIDFVWHPEKRLKDCAENRKYDYVISSHVWEHVPNPIGWLEQVLEVCNDGAIVAMALPLKYNPIDYIRKETEVSELVGNYLENRSIPSAKQVFDCLSNARKIEVAVAKNTFTPEEFATQPLSYSKMEAMGFAYRAFSQNIYTDVHCSVFSPESFPDLINKIRELGLLNIELIDVTVDGASTDKVCEFYVKIKKLPATSANPMWGGVSPLEKLAKEWGGDLKNIENSGHTSEYQAEAVAHRDILIAELKMLDNRLSRLAARFVNFVRPFLK